MRWLRNLGLGFKLSLLLVIVLIILLCSTIFLLNTNTQKLTEEVGGERVSEEVKIIESRLTEIEKSLTVNADFLTSSVTFYQAVGRRDAKDTGDIITRANESLGLDDIEVVDGDGNHLVDIRPGDDDPQKDHLLTQAL